MRTIRAGSLLSVFLLAATAALSAVEAPSPAPLDQGIELFRVGRYEKAEPLLREGLKAAPGDLEGLLSLVELYLGWSDYERAIPLAERAATIAPSSSRAHLRLAQSYGLKAMKISKLRALMILGDVRAEFEKAVSLDSGNIDARLGLMQFFIQAPSIGGGDLSQARIQADAVVALDPVQGLAAVARVATLQGKDAEALEAADRIAKIDAGAARLARSRFFKEKKNIPAAVAELVKVGEDDPKDAKDLTSAAVSLGGFEKWDEALGLLEKAQEADPSDMAVVYQVGRTCLLSGKNLPRAERAFRKYLAVESKPQAPSHASAHWRLGMVCEKLGRTAEARREYEEALRLEPGNEEARKALAGVGSR